MLFIYTIIYRCFPQGKRVPEKTPYLTPVPATQQVLLSPLSNIKELATFKYGYSTLYVVVASKYAADDLNSGWFYESFQERQCIFLARSFLFAQLDEAVGGRCGISLFAELNQFIHDVTKQRISLDFSLRFLMEIPRIFFVVIKVSEYFNNHIAFDYKFGLVRINLSCCDPIKVWYLCLSLLLNIILIFSAATKRHVD